MDKPLARHWQLFVTSPEWVEILEKLAVAEQDHLETILSSKDLAIIVENQGHVGALRFLRGLPQTLSDEEEEQTRD